jgi:Fur family ferric uptake transcriptional regulator
MATDDVHRAAEARLADRQQRYTTNRRAIVDTLVSVGAPITMPDLLSARPGLTQSSTYRNLAMLEDAAVVRRIVSGAEHAHYELAEDLTEHHHHLVCTTCGLIEDVTLTPALEQVLDQAFADAATERGFRTNGHAIDIYGRCPRCPA